MLRLAVVVCGAIACSIGLSVKSVYVLFKLCGDLVFVILFPQLLCVIYCSFANRSTLPCPPIYRVSHRVAVPSLVDQKLCPDPVVVVPAVSLTPSDPGRCFPLLGTPSSMASRRVYHF